MADALEPPGTPTALQAEMTAKSNAAVQDVSLGQDFDAEVEAAIAKDAGMAKEVEAAPATPPPPKAEAKAEKVAEKVEDIPEALFKKKEKAKTEESAVDPEREKFIKEQTAGLSTKAADRFRAIEAKAYAAEQKAAKADKLEKELTSLREQAKSATSNTELEALKKQAEELDEIVQKQALADHPRFKASFDAKIAEEVATAVKFAPKEAAAEVEALLALPETAQRNRRLNEIIGEIESPLEASKFQDAINKADRLNGEKQRELANWKVNKSKLSEITEQEKAQALEHRKAGIEKALKSVLPRFTNEENGVELFHKVEGNDEWNKKVEARLENVRKITEADLSPEDRAEMAAWAMSGAEYRKLFLTQRVLVQRLQDEIASLKSGEPGLGEGGAAPQDDDEKGGMIEVVTRMAQKAGALR